MLDRPIVGVEADGALARQFTTLTNALLEARTLAEALRLIIATAPTVIPAVHMASVTIRRADGTHYTPVQTTPLAVELDREQYRSGRGPCIDAATPHSHVLATSDDLAADHRWPEFAAAATGDGFRSVMASPLLPDPGPDRLPGALNLWSRDRSAFAPADRDHALLLATHASLALATAAAVSDADLERSQLRAAIESRDIIGQAKGILMGRRGLSADEAFDVLRRTSQDINVKLVDLAMALTKNPSGLDDATPNRT